MKNYEYKKGNLTLKPVLVSLNKEELRENLKFLKKHGVTKELFLIGFQF